MLISKFEVLGFDLLYILSLRVSENLKIQFIEYLKDIPT